MRFLLWSVLAMVTAPLAGAVTLHENFSSDPALNGWQTYGETNLFAWNASNQNLEVTWDSTRSNSYFLRSLGTILTTNDEFALEFDLRLDDAQIGGFGFEIAIGLLNFASATNANFFRGTGRNAPNIAEFDYFPDFGYGPSIDGTLVDSNATNSHFFYVNLPLEFGTVYHVSLEHPANTASLDVQIFANGDFYTDLPIPYNTPKFFDFRLDTLSISSYSGARSGGSILAHGTVDNLIVTLPPPPIQNVHGCWTNGTWRVEFASQNKWIYTLEQTVDFQSWAGISTATPGNGANLFLTDTNAVAVRGFYRVRAERP